jgi:hypothetical protein
MALREDRQQLTGFLARIKGLLAFLTFHRVPEERRRPYAANLERDLVPRIDFTIAEIESIESERDPRWQLLGTFGLVGEALRFKLDEFTSWFSIGRIRNILKSANSILGSLSRVFGALEPVKEFKDHLELRLSDDYMEGDDEEITKLDL